MLMRATDLYFSFNIFVWFRYQGNAVMLGLPWWPEGKSVCLQCGRPGSDPWVGKIPWSVGNGNELHYSCLENPMGGGAWQAAVHGVAKSWTRLRDFTFTSHFHALEEEMATPVFLPGESQGRRSLLGCRLWGCTELDTIDATQQQQQQFGIRNQPDPKNTESARAMFSQANPTLTDVLKTPEVSSVVTSLMLSVTNPYMCFLFSYLFAIAQNSVLCLIILLFCRITLFPV